VIAPTATRAPLKIGCQNNVQADGYRIFKANITIYSAGDCAGRVCTGTTTVMKYPTNYKMQVTQPVKAGPVVLTFKFYSQSGEMLYEGEKVGQAQTDNSHIIANFEDMADPCDTKSKGRGVFAVTMNPMTTQSVVTPNWLSVDPNYYSRQRLVWYWPSDDFPAESPDLKLVLDTPYTYSPGLPRGVSPSPSAGVVLPIESHVYGDNPLQAKSLLPFPNFMQVRRPEP
jgi:hypothetical protein